MIPVISISEGVPTIFLPLFIIVLVTAIKDGYEDYKRRKSDKEENRSLVEVFNINTGKFE